MGGAAGAGRRTMCATVMRRAAVAWAALCVGTEGVAMTRYQCKLMDGSTRQVSEDLAGRFPGLVSDCTRVAFTAANEPDPFLDPVRTWSPVRVITAPKRRTASQALPAGLGDLIESAADRHGVDPKLVQAVIQVESAFAVSARSPKGALGLMQVMPATGARFGARSPEHLLDPAVNIDVGVRYLRVLGEQFGNRTELVLAAYNAGEGAVIRYGYQVPPYRETREYVRKIMDLYPDGR